MKELNDEALNRFITQMQEAYLFPEIKSRLEKKLISEDLEVKAFQILINMNKPVEVLLNSEIRGVVKFKSQKQVQAGETININAIESIGQFILLEADANSAHITYIALPDDLTFLSFSFRYNGLLRWERFKTAKEFNTAAKYALENKLFRAFHENTFAAMESAISALLIAIPDRSYLTSRKHNAWHTRINKWGQLGNVDLKYVELFNQLSQDRGAARYSFEEFQMNDAEVKQITDTCHSFLEFVEGSMTEYHPGK